MLYQLSYEATQWEQGKFVEFISPVRRDNIMNLPPQLTYWRRCHYMCRDIASWLWLQCIMDRKGMSTPSRWRGDVVDIKCCFGKWAFILSRMIERTANYERATTDCQFLNILHGLQSRMKADCDQRSSGNWIERDKREFLGVLIWVSWWINRVYLHVWKACEETGGPYGPQRVNKENNFVCRRDFGNPWGTGSAIGHYYCKITKAETLATRETRHNSKFRWRNLTAVSEGHIDEEIREADEFVEFTQLAIMRIDAALTPSQLTPSSKLAIPPSPFTCRNV